MYGLKWPHGMSFDLLVLGKRSSVSSSWNWECQRRYQPDQNSTTWLAVNITELFEWEFTTRFKWWFLTVRTFCRDFLAERLCPLSTNYHYHRYQVPAWLSWSCSRYACNQEHPDGSRTIYNGKGSSPGGLHAHGWLEYDNQRWASCHLLSERWIVGMWLTFFCLAEITYTAWCEEGFPPPGFEQYNHLYPNGLKRMKDTATK